MTVTIYHNPDCGTSRRVLAMIETAGETPQVIDYRRTGWTRETLTALFAAMDARPRDLLRIQGTPAEALGLVDPATPDEAILAAMLEHPILVQRPIVVTPRGTRLCRPAETVAALL